jgi:hypothetical protein
MNIVPPMNESGSPTIIIDTTDAAMKAEGLPPLRQNETGVGISDYPELAIQADVPPAQTTVMAQLAPVQPPRRLTRPSIKKSAVAFAEPVSQTPHTGGAEEEDQPTTTSSTGSYFGKITVEKLG